MTIRDAVEKLVDNGPLPDSDADEETIERAEHLIAAVEPPVKGDEAQLLVGLFGQGECFGLAWTLLHIIETAPQSPVQLRPRTGANEWELRLWKRSKRQA